MASAAHAHVPTQELRQFVQVHVACGTTEEVLCKLLGLSGKTIRKHYREELDFGAALANAMVAGKLFQKAMSGDQASMFFWLKTRARWRESPTELELKGADGGPVAISVNFIVPKGHQVPLPANRVQEAKAAARAIPNGHTNGHAKNGANGHR